MLLQHSRLRQEDGLEFEVSLEYRNPCLKNKLKTKQRDDEPQKMALAAVPALAEDLRLGLGSSSCTVTAP